MNRIFDWIEKYKFGLIATVAAYMFIFTYLQMSSYTKHFPISPFQEGPEIENAEEILLDQDQIQVPQNFTGDVKNMTRDRNDQRERSDNDYSENQAMDGESYAKALEQSYKDETGGEAKRAEIRKEYEEYKKQQEANKKENNPIHKGNNSSTGGDKVYSGNVLVEWELSSRNSNRLPIPGYMCGRGASGQIVIDISVNQNGNVVSAKFNSSRSTSSNYCMIKEAKAYAMKSRFNYSSKASNSQSGRITYTFISQ